MKVLLAGAFGKLGTDILKSLIAQGHDIIAIDMIEKDIPELKGSFTFTKIDVTNKESLKDVCKNVDTVITTIGLTSSSTTVSNYDIDYNGNLNLLADALANEVKQFIYISVLKADGNPDVPMLHAKYLFEEELKKSGISYVIHRPTGYFYDIAKVFMPMIDKGTVTLLGKKPVHANVIDTTDLADFIILHLKDHNVTYDIGGTETYSYEEIAGMFFTAANKPVIIKRAPAFLFTILAFLAKKRKNGKEAIIKFSKWTLSEEMVAEHQYGKLSFKEYIKNCYH